MSNLLSVGIPAYNKADFLKELLLELCFQVKHVNESGLHQVDICISDDCLNNSNLEIVQSFQEKYNFIIYAKNQKPGFIANLENIGKLSKSQFVWFLSEDDQIMPLKLPKLVQYLLKYDDGTLNAVILSRAILDADTGHIYDEHYMETQLYTCNSPILQCLNYGDLNVLARLIIRRQFINGHAWSTRDDFALFPQLTGLLEAISQGKHLWIGETLVLYRYLKDNSNWTASSTIGQALEFPAYNSLARSLGIPAQYLHSSYCKKSGIYSYLKIRLLREEYGEKLAHIAEQRLNADVSYFRWLKLYIDFLLETLGMQKILYRLFVNLKPNTLLEAQAVRKHLQRSGQL